MGRKWGTHIGEDREQRLVFILCLNRAGHFAEHYIYVFSFTSGLIVWLDYSLNTWHAVFKYKYENTLKCKS